MPFAKYKSVREVSSEDDNCPAVNLLKASAAKWKTKAIGEKVAYVILEFNEPYMITGIDIGNEFSAFIEVLVGKTSNSSNFTEILVTCSFMTPIESKNSTNPNRVRCFNKAALVPTAATEKWKFIKLICTQPFNRHIQYGISFIKIHVVESELANTRKPVTDFSHLKKSPACLNISQLGKFKLREESPDSDSESSTALFKRWKASEWNDSIRSTPSALLNLARSKTDNPQLVHSSPSNTTRQIGILKKECHQNIKTTVARTKSVDVLDRNREELAFGYDKCAESQDVNKKNQKTLETVQFELKTEISKARKEQMETMGNTASTQSKTTIKKLMEQGVNNEHLDKMPNTKPHKNRSPLKKCMANESNSTAKLTAAAFRPFSQLLKGTIIVISGIQNPERSDLRDKALAMGAKYRSDWQCGCTHLICAFKNTPKYNEVKGKGKIVTRQWIEDCHRQKKKIPWRRYALDSSDLNQPDSEEEILDESLRPVELTAFNDNSGHPNSSLSSSNSNDVKSFIVTSESDTEDEIQQVLQTNDKRKVRHMNQRTVFDFTTEEEDFLVKKTKLKSTLKQPGFFNGVKFFICNDIKLAERKRIEQLLEINEGLSTCHEVEAKYLISYDQVTNRNSSTNAILVRPDWIYECYDMEMEVPINKYIL